MKELIERLRQKAGQYDEYDWHSVTELKAADALERLTTERDALRTDAERYRKLCAILQKAYDTDSFGSERLTIYCEQLSGWRNERTVEARLVWLDARDAGLDLSSAIDAAIGEKT